jgi:hypothetical protein
MDAKMRFDTNECETDPVYRMYMRLPFCCEWIEYDGETYVAQFNYEASKKAGRTMIDLSYCMTKALNQIIMRTVRWSPKRFGPSPLATTEYKSLKHKLTRPATNSQ